jgi:Trp operon repressor
MEAKQFYKNRIESLTLEQKKLRQRKSIFGILRLGTMLAIIAAFYFLWSANKYYTIAAAVILIIVFIQLIYRDLANKAAIKHLQYLLNINEDELTALDGKYNQFADGIQFAPHDHFYANDMDVFGRASLYQFLNRTTSELGAEKLATWLLTPETKEKVIQRQTAVQELVTKNKWRHNLQAIGKESSIKKNTLKKIKHWLQEPNLFLQFKPWQWLRWVLPIIICSITALYSFDIITEQLWYLFLFIFLAIAYQINKIVAPLHNTLSSMVEDVGILSESIAAIEKENFTSPLLQRLKTDLQKQNIAASSKIKKLKKILDRLDLRYNIVIAIPLNIFLMWNLQQVLDLEKWKKENDDNVQLWFDTLAEFEALISFATLHFNNPNYCFPTLIENHFFIAATELGHPLIHQSKRVNNFIHIETAGEIMLVTGSNMAGKSTYLRSIGINVILTMAGAPVCAKSFALSPVQLLSSMRIADNLEENTSTFYAELKKLKTVIEKINAGEKVFVLLDEILRGTNSLDRHTGSEALIRQLIKQNAAAILATHDVALATLEKEYPKNILNYHFDAQTKGEELFFDYKLKDGVCTNMNASLLMKKIGLEI